MSGVAGWGIAALLIIALGLVALVWRAIQGLEHISEKARRAQGDVGQAAGEARFWREHASRSEAEARQWRGLVLPDDPRQQPMPLTRRLADRDRPRDPMGTTVWTPGEDRQPRYEPPVQQPVRTQQDPIAAGIAEAMTAEMEAVASGPAPRRRGHLAPVRPQADEA